MSDNKPLIEKKEIHLAILGQTPGNGHPYSWSAMFNGYDRDLMTKECPYAGIPAYLNKEPEGFQIPDVKITHICTNGEGDFTAEHVARCALIPNVVENPEDVIGKVDAVIIATDIGSEHVDRCRPFIEADIPLFIDKPMVDNAGDLKIFNEWVGEGKALMSSSSMRYTKEFLPYRASTNNLGKLRFGSIMTSKKWETYGIHALEAIYPIFGPGFISARNTGTKDRNVVHFTHTCGADVIVIASKDMHGGFGLLTLAGTEGSDQLAFKDSFYAFRKQLVSFVDYLRTGIRPFPYSETEELMRMVIAGIQSRESGGTEILLKEIL